MTSRSARLSLQAGLIFALTAIQTACNRGTTMPSDPTIELKSPGFSGTIPNQFSSCAGQANNSPPLSWQSPPARTQSLALIVTDPDAPGGTFTQITN